MAAYRLPNISKLLCSFIVESENVYKKQKLLNCILLVMTNLYQIKLNY